MYVLWDSVIIIVIIGFAYAYAFPTDVPKKVTRRALVFFGISFLVFNVVEIIKGIGAIMGYVFF